MISSTLFILARDAVGDDQLDINTSGRSKVRGCSSVGERSNALVGERHRESAFSSDDFSLFTINNEPRMDKIRMAANANRLLEKEAFLVVPFCKESCRKLSKGGV
ncbi:hypothetical protein IIC38_03675 [candidate division KSB1 bacterium]|nr:hypothetical protein [candidate division KSB1 bacterium]